MLFNNLQNKKLTKIKRNTLHSEIIKIEYEIAHKHELLTLNHRIN